MSNADASVRITFEPPPVTILIPSYNRVGYLQETIASCLAQDYPHCRVLITDDGSTDGTIELVSGLGSLGIRLVRGPHAGAPTNRNRGLAAVETPYVLWIGDDDVLVHDIVSRRIRRLSEVPDADVIHGDTAICDAQLNVQSLITGEDWSARRDALISALFQRNVMTDAGSLISMAVYARAGFYDPAFPKAQDYHLWSRAAGSCKFVHDAGVGMLWRWHGTNMGLGSGANPYADAHRRIVLDMWTRYDKRLLFPEIAWDAIASTDHDAMGAVAMAERLMREEAWEDAHRFVRIALALGAGDDARRLAATLAPRLSVG